MEVIKLVKLEVGPLLSQVNVQLDFATKWGIRHSFLRSSELEQFQDLQNKLTETEPEE